MKGMTWEEFNEEIKEIKDLEIGKELDRLKTRR